MRQWHAGLGIVAAALVLVGCYESTEVTVYDPGVYKGEEDPLMAKQRKEAQQERLRQRFRQVQTDR